MRPFKTHESATQRQGERVIRVLARATFLRSDNRLAPERLIDVWDLERFLEPYTRCKVHLMAVKGIWV